jgi:phosphate uptake regulator
MAYAKLPLPTSLPLRRPIARPDMQARMGCSYRPIADYARAITLHGKFTLAYYNRGLAQERLGDNAAAVNDDRRVLAPDSTTQSARLRLERLFSS